MAMGFQSVKAVLQGHEEHEGKAGSRIFFSLFMAFMSFMVNKIPNAPFGQQSASRAGVRGRQLRHGFVTNSNIFLLDRCRLCTREKVPMKTSHLALAVLVAALGTTGLQAQPLVTIDTVFVGDAGNAAANSSNAPSWGYNYGYGSVGYDYAIGRTEVTISQYTTFLNAVAASDPYKLWNSNMETDLNIAGISRAGSSGSYTYSTIGSGNRPITYVSWFDAARFTNWLHNGATVGADTETGAYTLNGATSGIITKNVGAKWWIPSEDEWVKAAYYDPISETYSLHANQSDIMSTNTIGAAGGANYNDGDYATTQSGSYSSSQNYLTDVGAYADTVSYYGTFDQAGNVWEWNDAVSVSTRGLSGGAWDGDESDMWGSSRRFQTPTLGDPNVGFRVASVPEPSTALLMLIGGAVLLTRKRCRATL